MLYEVITLAGGDAVEGRSFLQMVLLQFVLQQTQGQGGAEDRRIAEALQQKGDGADMVFVPVGQHQAADIANA